MNVIDINDPATLARLASRAVDLGLFDADVDDAVETAHPEPVDPRIITTAHMAEGSDRRPY